MKVGGKLVVQVVQAETVDTFKNRLDKYWSKRAMLNYAGNAGDGFMQDAAAWRC